MLDVWIREKRFATSGSPPRPVLRDVRFSAGPGQVIALLGRSGAGKSSLLRIALGLDHDFDGHVATSPGRRGVVFQEPLLLPWLTVAENLQFVVTGDVAAPDVAALLAAVGLGDAGSRRPDQLSLGMARRAAVARALAVDPAVLVLDEPFVSLDRRLAGELGVLLISRARRNGTLVIVAMHDLEHAVAIADRVLVLHGQPAFLAADISVPDRADGVAMTALREELRGRFAFLGACDDETEGGVT